MPREPQRRTKETSSPDLRGRVTSVGPTDFVLKQFDGTSEIVNTTTTTTYTEPGSAVAPTGVVDGEHVVATLDVRASSPTATSVTVEPERVGGRVSNVSGSTLTVTTRDGTDSVIVTADTKYLEKDATPTGVTAGEIITAFGLPDPSTPGALDAQIISIFSPPPAQPVTPAPVPQPPAPQPQPQPQPQPVAASQPQAVAPASPPSHSGWTPGQPATPHPDDGQGPVGWGRSTPSQGSPVPHGSANGHGLSGGSGFGGR